MLGDRSQAISSIVEAMGTISARTDLLALSHPHRPSENPSRVPTSCLPGGLVVVEREVEIRVAVKALLVFLISTTPPGAVRFTSRCAVWPSFR